MDRIPALWETSQGKAETMTVDDLRTIAGMMNNDCPKGTVSVYWITQRNYRGGKYVDADKVANKSQVWIQWDAEGMATKILGKFRAMNGGYPETVQLETIDGGMVDKYLNMIKWFSV